MTGGDAFVLFCNDGYGRAFQPAFRAWCERRSIERYLLVKSLKGKIPPGPRGGMSRLGAAVGNRARSLLGSRVLLAEKVNDPRFARAYLSPPGRLFGIVAGFNQIFRPGTIRRFHRLYNFHPSLLPYYRGPVPSYWCIQNGEERAGITLHEIGPEIDRGRILWQEALEV